jgi:hypothetical protein
MSDNLPEFHSVAHLRQQAALYAGGLFDRPWHQSLPIPTSRNQQLEIAFLYSHAEIVEPQQGMKIWPPRFIAYIAPATAKLELIRSVMPSTFELNHNPEQSLGSWRSPAECLDDEFLTDLARFLQLFDQLLPHFAIRTPITSANIAESVEEFRKVYARIREGALLEYYAKLAPAFLEWGKFGSSK